MTTVRIASDLHFEFHRDGGAAMVGYLSETPADIIVVAGDLAVGKNVTDALRRLADAFPNVVYSSGNHESYKTNNKDLGDAIAAAVATHSNVHWLDESSVTINGHRFLGGTMWFRRPVSTSVSYERLKSCMNDFDLIPDFESWVYEKNRSTVGFLENGINPGDVVVTHHLPAAGSVHRRYRGEPLNALFLCDVSYTIEKTRPALWVHGHTHESCYYMHGPTRVVCNPFGYLKIEENRNFEFDKTIEL